MFKNAISKGMRKIEVSELKLWNSLYIYTEVVYYCFLCTFHHTHIYFREPTAVSPHIEHVFEWITPRDFKISMTFPLCEHFRQSVCSLQQVQSNIILVCPIPYTFVSCNGGDPSTQEVFPRKAVEIQARNRIIEKRKRENTSET